MRSLNVPRLYSLIFAFRSLKIRPLFRQCLNAKNTAVKIIYDLNTISKSTL